MFVKKILSKLPIIRDYRSFKHFNLCTNPSFVRFVWYQIWPRFKKNRYFPYDKNTSVSGKNIILGKGSVVGQRGGCYIQGIGKLFIGDYVRIAQNCVIISANHSAVDHSIEIKKETIIGDYSWVASNACIMAGVVLGPRTIVGAGSVVTKSFPNGYCVIAGNPARMIKEIPREEFVRPQKENVEFYGYIRADKFRKYVQRYYSYLKFDYDLTLVTENQVMIEQFNRK